MFSSDLKVLWILEGFTVRVWNLRFYRVFEDWELVASFSLLQLVQTRILGVIGEILFIGG